MALQFISSSSDVRVSAFATVRQRKMNLNIKLYPSQRQSFKGDLRRIKISLAFFCP